MDADARIARMESAGLLSADQANALRDSVRGSARGGLDIRRGFDRRWRTIGVAGAAVAAVLAVAWLASGTGPSAVVDVSQSLNQPGEHGEMNRSFGAFLSIALFLIVPLLAWVLLHNGLVAKEEGVFEAWAQTESNFQRRADLIPALVESVATFQRHERETLGEVTEARAQADEGLTEAIDDLIRASKELGGMPAGEGGAILVDDQALARLHAAQSALGRSIGGVFAVAEAYPDLRSADQFLELQAQLEGSENRINVARMRFNAAVREFNAAIRQLPWSLVASLGGFERKAYFRSAEEARDAGALGFE